MPAAAPTETAARGYAAEWRRAAIAMLLASAVVLLLFHDLAQHAIGVWWRSQVFHHCFIILPLAAYMLWQRASYAVQFRPDPDLRFLLLLPVIGLGYLLVRFAGIIELQQHAVLAMLQVLFVMVLGWSAWRSVAWPLLYLFFLVPSGEFLVPILQDYTAWFSVLALNVTGIPVYADGTFLMIPNGNFEVAEACAGVRFLIAMLAFGGLFADVIYRSPWRKVVFLIASVIAPVVANGFRAYGIVALGYYTGNASAVAADHLVYGWVFFSIVMVVLMAIGIRYREDDLPYGPPPPPAAGPPAGLARVAMTAVLMVALVAVLPAWARVVEGRLAPIQPGAFDGLTAAAPWRQVPLTQSGWKPTYPRADATLQRAYTDGSRRVELFIAYFASQDSEKKLIGGDNRFDANERWRRIGGGAAPGPIADTGLRPVVERHAGPSGQRLLWYTYWVDDSFLTGGMSVKARQALAELRGGGHGSAIVILSTDFTEQVEPANAALADFARALGPLSPVLRRLAGHS